MREGEREREEERGRRGGDNVCVRGRHDEVQGANQLLLLLLSARVVKPRSTPSALHCSATHAHADITFPRLFHTLTFGRCI